MARNTLSHTGDTLVSVRMSQQIATRIDDLRAPTRMPRNSWILQAIIEKFERLENEERRKELEKKQNSEGLVTDKIHDEER